MVQGGGFSACERQVDCCAPANHNTASADVRLSLFAQQLFLATLMNRYLVAKILQSWPFCCHHDAQRLESLQPSCLTMNVLGDPNQDQSE